MESPAHNERCTPGSEGGGRRTTRREPGTSPTAHQTTSGTAALLSVVLVGLPELDDRLALRRNRSLYSRLHQRFAIDSLSPEDTAEYLRLRLGKVGCDRDLFPSEATAMIHEAALGSLREIDRIATAALREATRRKRKLVERDAVARVVAAARDE